MVSITDNRPQIEIISDLDSFATRAFELFLTDAEKAISSKGNFYTAISGGNTPRRFFELLGQSPGGKKVPWKKVHLFWVDERYVPPDSNRSNYKLAADTFLSKIDIPAENIHRIPTEDSDYQLAAQRYEQSIRDAFNLSGNQKPQFDLIMLGMGPDGHTGSLFPNSYAAFDTEDLATVVYALDEKLNRITLTHPVLCAACHLAVMVAGEEKAQILKEVLTSEYDDVRFPIHTLWPVLHKVTWLIDSKAAKYL